MLGGRKRAVPGESLEPSSGGGAGRGILILALAAAGVWAMVRFA